jgi:hypothetical protein
LSKQHSSKWWLTGAYRSSTGYYVWRWICFVQTIHTCVNHSCSSKITFVQLFQYQGRLEEALSSTFLQINKRRTQKHLKKSWRPVSNLQLFFKYFWKYSVVRNIPHQSIWREADDNFFLVLKELIITGDFKMLPKDKLMSYKNDSVKIIHLKDH